MNWFKKLFGKKQNPKKEQKTNIPQGPPQGVQGFQGPQGVQGFQGPQGDGFLSK